MSFDFGMLRDRLDRGIQQLTSTSPSGLNAWFDQAQFSRQPIRRAEIYEMLGALIADGKPLDASLRTLKSRYTEKKRPNAGILAAWLNSMAEGDSFGDAVKGYAKDAEAIILSASEKSGDLAGGFKKAADLARAGAKIRGVIFAELAGPILQTLMLMFMLVGFSTSLAPELTKSVPVAYMDPSAQVLFKVAGVVAQLWIYALILIVAFLVFVAWTVPRYTGRFRPILNKIPPYSVYRTYTSATFMISLSALIGAGIPIESAIRFIRELSSPWMKERLSIMVGRMQAGIEQGAAMDTGLLTDNISDMVSVYASTANFGESVSSLGAFATADGIKTIEKQTQIANLLTKIALAVLITWMLTSVFSLGEAGRRAAEGSQPIAITGK